MSKEKHIYRISFADKGEVYEIYAKHVYQSDMFGFLTVEDIIFGESNRLVVDPAEERLKTEFKGVKSTYIPLHAINRIDEVARTGIAKIKELKTNNSNISYFPSSLSNKNFTE